MKRILAATAASALLLTGCMSADYNLEEEHARYMALTKDVTALDEFVEVVEAEKMTCRISTCNPKSQRCEGVYDASDDDYMGTTVQRTDTPGTFTRIASCRSPKSSDFSLVYCEIFLSAVEADGVIAVTKTSKMCTGP